MSLIVDKVSHSFGADRALDQLSLDVEPGEIVCLFGPSGCGKTTLLRLIAGFETLAHGQITLNAQLLARPGDSLVADQRPIGFVFQDFALFPHMTVEKNIAFGLKGLSGKERKERIADELASVNLSNYAHKYPHELSGGQQQRVALARAFARRPAAMLLDEPFASLDVTMRRRLRTSMRAMLKAHHVTALIVTHDPEEALALSDRIVVMNEGRLIEASSPTTLFHKPKTLQGAMLIVGSQKIEGTFEDEGFKTDFGALKVSKDKAPNVVGQATIVVREEALSLVSDTNGQARVVDCRFKGPGWITSIVPNEEGVPNQSLEVGTDEAFEIGDRLSVKIASVAGIFTDA